MYCIEGAVGMGLPQNGVTILSTLGIIMWKHVLLKGYEVISRFK
jgi:hypothetical protein